MTDATDAATRRAAQLDLLTDAAGRLLTPLIFADERGASVLVAGLQPREGDWAKVFVGDAAVRARAGYEGLWAGPPPPGPKPEQTRLAVVAATSDQLKEGAGAAEHFPGGYADIAAHLQPGRVWFAWKWLAPGASAGMAWDGLVWVDDHWAWFPKPWRVLGQA